MPDFSMKRSEYMRIMMGNRKDALAPYRPDQMNDLGDTSFDVASLSDEDINSAIAQMQGSKYERSDIFKSLQTEQTSRKEKAEQEKRDKPWYEAIGDFFSNIGTSITEGVLNVVDDVWDFTIGIAGGIGGGWFGQENDFTDWVASAITDDRWINTATKALTFANPIEMATNIGNGQYWNGFWDWTPENLEKQYAENYEGMEWLRTGGNFVGEIIPSLVLAYFTGGASLGVQAAVQGGLGLARGMGNAQSRLCLKAPHFSRPPDMAP